MNTHKEKKHWDETTEFRRHMFGRAKRQKQFAFALKIALIIIALLLLLFIAVGA